jgi:hybrid cluster-associated redox disulfide protein
MDKTEPTAEMTIEQVSIRWPQTIPVFRHYIEACVGCSLAPFCTVREAASEFDLSLDDLLSDLRKSINRDL